MRLKRLILPGRFVESYLYFDFVWLFGRDGSVRAFDIAAYCEARLNGDGKAATVLFSDNRILESDGIFQVGLREKVNQLLSVPSSIEVASEDVDRFSYIFEKVLTFKSLLDVRFYYGRGYVGTDASIVQLDARNRQQLSPEPQGKSSDANLGQRKVSELPARAFRCRFGAVGAACGPAGGLIGFEASTEQRNWTVEFMQFAPKSFGLELNGHAVTNLEDVNRVQIYAAELRSEPLDAPVIDPDEKREPAHLESLDGPSYSNQTEQLNRIFERDDAAGVFLFGKTAWQFSVNGTARRVDIIDQDLNVMPDLTSHPVKRKAPGRILAMSTTDAGILAETDDEVLILDGAGWRPLVKEAVHSMRGYQNSKRYQRVVTAVTRDRVELITLWKDQRKASR